MTKNQLNVHLLGHTSLRRTLLRKGVTVQNEKVLRAAIFVAKIRDSSPNAHALRLRYAKKLSDLIDSFIAEESRTANSKDPKDPGYLSWTSIAVALEMSKTAAYTRYGSKCKR